MTQFTKAIYGKIIFFSAKDIKSFPVLINKNDCKSFKISYKALPYINETQNILLEYSNDNEKITYKIKIISEKDRVVTYDIIDKVDTIYDLGFNSVDYKGNFKIAEVQLDEIEEYKDIVEEINFNNKNDIGKKIRETILSGYDDPIILNILNGINSKVDKILNILSKGVDITSSFDVKCISISGDGFIFYTEKDFASSYIFATSFLTNSEITVKFASICEICSISKNIWKATFKNIDEEIRDDIIKFIFVKEREILKEARL